MHAIVSYSIPTNDSAVDHWLTSSKKRPLLFNLLLLTLVLVITSGCDNGTPSPQVKQAPSAQLSPETALPQAASAALTTTLWQNLQIQLKHALKHLPPFTLAVQKLLDQPTSQHLQNAQALWQPLAFNLEQLGILGALANHQSQQNTANWQLVADAYQRIMAWPSELGFLDNNGTHGNTGLVFTLDLTITPDSLNAIHHLTHQQDGVFGLYPLGLMLQGAYSPRQASQLVAITTFNKEHKQQKLQNLEEHPQNRRRALIALQMQELANNLNALQALTQRRDNRSALNAFSQYSPSQQQLYLLLAAQHLTGLQLQELTHYSDLPPWQHQWQYQRLKAQLTGLEQWLMQLGHRQEAAICQDIINTLKRLSSPIHLSPSKHPSLTAAEPSKSVPTQTPSKQAATNTQQTSISAQQTNAITQQTNTITQPTNTVTQPSNDPHNHLKEQLAGLTVALKRAINISASNSIK